MSTEHLPLRPTTGWLPLIAAAMSGAIVAGLGGLLAQRDASIRVASTVELHSAQIAQLQQGERTRAVSDGALTERMARIETTLDDVRELLRRPK